MIDVIARCRSGAVKRPGAGGVGYDVPKLSGHDDGRDPTRFSRMIKLEKNVERPSVGRLRGREGWRV